MSIEIVDLDEKQQQELTTNNRRFIDMSTRKLNEAEQSQLDSINEVKYATFDDNGHLESFRIEYTKHWNMDVEDLGHLNIRKEDIKQGLTEDQWDKLYSAYSYFAFHGDNEPDWHAIDGDVDCDFIDFLFKVSC